MKIESKTNEEIRAHIIKMVDSYNKTGKDLYLRIKEDCEAELKRRAGLEKKSDPQPIEKVKQLPQKPELEDWAQKIGIEAKEARRDFESSASKLMGNDKPSEAFKKSLSKQPGLLEQVINLVAPPSAPEQIVEIEIEIDGKMVVEQYSIGALRDKARTWFTQTAESAAINGKGKLEKSLQYRRLCAVVPNWEQFYGYKPKVQDLHRRHNLHGEAVKSAAVRLLQILTQ